MNGYPRFGWVDILRFQHNDIINYLMVTLGGTNEHLYNNVLGRLNQTDSICNIKNETKQFKLTDTKREEIAQIKEKAHLAMDKVSHECQLICAKYNLDLDVSQINIYVCNLFATNYSNDTGEFCRGSINPSLILNIFFHQFLWPLQLLTS